MAVPTVALSNGQKCPVLGFGTWQGVDDPSVVEQAIKDAIDAGFRHIDCAYIYGNEKEIGRAIRKKIAEGVLKREDLFIVTKLWNTQHREALVVPSCKESLKNFGLDYIDLYLIHWPFACGEDAEDTWPVDEHGNPSGKDTDYLETWRGMEECVRLGLTKSIGLSNFNSEQIDRILSVAKIKPVMNQVEVHPYFNQNKLTAFCAKRGIAVTAYSPFGAPSGPWAKPGDPKVAMDEPEIIAIAKKYGKKPAQVILRYLVHIGTIPIPKSSSKQRIQDNINIFDFKLTPEEIAVMKKFNCKDGRNLVANEFKTHKYYPFHLEY